MANETQGIFNKLRERGWLAPILQSLVVLTVWVLVAYLTVRLLSDDGNGNAANTTPPAASVGQGAVPPGTPLASGASAAPTQPSLTGTATSQDPVALAVAGCESRWEAQGRPLQAIHDAMEQWRLHINAMNKLVAGTISLDQATAFWRQTEAGAKRNIQRFQAADLVYTHEASVCEPPAGMTAAAVSGSQLGSCMRAVQASDHLLRVGRIAVGTWEHHVHDMEALMAGVITADQAASAWQQNWRTGNRQLFRYEAAREDSLRTQCSL